MLTPFLATQDSSEQDDWGWVHRDGLLPRLDKSNHLPLQQAKAAPGPKFTTFYDFAGTDKPK